MRFILLIFIALGSFITESSAQIFNPVHWTFEKKDIGSDKFELVFQATIDDGWSIYSQYLENDDGPIRTSFEFDKGDHFSLIGKNDESGGRKEAYDVLFEMNVIKFVKKGIFKQVVKVEDYSKPITGFLEFMTCDDTKCLPPKQIDFEFEVNKEETPASPKTGLVDPPVQIKETIQAVEETKTSPKIEEAIAKTENIGGRKKDFKSGSRKSKKGKEVDTRHPSKSVDGNGQIFDPVDWTAELTARDDGKVELKYKAIIDEGWHIYSMFLEEGDAIPTSLNFDEAEHFSLSGKTKEESPVVHKVYDEGLEMNLIELEESATYTQLIDVKDAMAEISGYLEFAVCDKIGCLPPEAIPFIIQLSKNRIILGDEADGQLSEMSSVQLVGNEIDQSVAGIQATYKDPVGDCGEEDVATGQGLLWTFLLGFLGGMVALVTPCVWPMIPLTVSFFTKGSKDKASGIKNGLVYGLSIIGIYVGLGLLINGIFGPTALNALSTNWVANVTFFALFIAFAISFFGYYEITLPASWANKSDAMAEKGGYLGIFFMASTLAIVSFSCTGPIIGSALVTAASSSIGPAVVMLGFSLALALPFGLFAAFPAWLNSLPKSGSWMTSVKVVLGFVELALALKFLSVADMTMHWGILKYELFLGLWTLIAFLTAAYLFGFIKFPHDSPMKKLSPIRGTFALLFLAFGAYLVTGFFTNEKTQQYNSLSLMSGLAPPAIYNYLKPMESVDPVIKSEYSTYSKCANNLNCFKDYYEGMSYAKENNIPVLLDFTGYGCVNCRKTEEHIWIDDRVWEKLDQEFVLISLYVDDRNALDETLISKNTKDRIRNVGNKWADFQIVNFQQNSQPLYVMMSPDEKVLAAPRGYKEGVKSYVDFLECGLETFKGLKNDRQIGSLN